MPPTSKSPEEILEEMRGILYFMEMGSGEDFEKVRAWLRAAMASVILWAAEETGVPMDGKIIHSSALLALADRISKGEEEPKLKDAGKG